MVLFLAFSLVTVAASAQGQATFTRDVAPILFRHCVPCHQRGGIGPFRLDTWDAARARSADIASVTATRRMPPWLPEDAPGTFVGERRLSPDEIGTLRRWAETGAPEGDPAAPPPPPPIRRLGEPDLVVTMPEAYTVPESGRDIFRSFVLPVPLESDRFVRAMEFLPGNREVVHHAVVLVDRARSARVFDSLDPGPGWAGMQSGLAESPDGHFLGWTPGKTALEVPAGMAWRLPRGSDLVLQLHLLPRPSAPPVQVRIGFHFTEDAPSRTATRLRLGTKAMDVPAGEDDYRIRDAYRLPVEVDLIGLYPHAHHLAREMRAWVELPDGGRRSLLRIAEWDFNWQAEYRWQQPVTVPAGARLAMEYRYDNSADNGRNPHDPPRRVLYGPESSDEMGDLWIQAVPRRAAELPVLQRDFARKETAARLAGYRFRLERNPDDEKALYSLAGMLAEIGEREEAIRRLEAAVRIRPDFAMALSDLGRLRFRSGETDRAESLFRRAVEAAPGLPTAHHNLGAVRLAEGRPGEAEAHFRRALAEWPDFAEAHFGLGDALAARGESGEALAHYRRAVAARPDFALAHFRIGNLLSGADDGDGAIRHYDAAIAADPRFAPARFNRAAVLARQGKSEEAAGTLRRLLEIEPDHAAARELLERLGVPESRERAYVEPLLIGAAR